MPSKKDDKGKKASGKNGSQEAAGVKMEWAGLDPVIPVADAFYFVYSVERAVLHVGVIEQMLSVGASYERQKEVPVHMLGRYMLTPKALIRLKDKVDETYEGMKAKGAFNE